MCVIKSFVRDNAGAYSGKVLSRGKVKNGPGLRNELPVARENAGLRNELDPF